MRAELTLSMATLYGFLLTLARVTAALVFVPLPGIKQGPELARVVLALSATLLLAPQWPVVEGDPSMGRLTGWLILEAGLGILIGVVAGFMVEAFQIAAQAMGLEAGFAYASMVDPQTQADSGVLLVLAQLGAGLTASANQLRDPQFKSVGASVAGAARDAAMNSPIRSSCMPPMASSCGSPTPN